MQWYTKQNKTIMLMEPAINLYSSNEKSELIRENSQEILSVLAAHHIKKLCGNMISLRANAPFQTIIFLHWD